MTSEHTTSGIAGTSERHGNRLVPTPLRARNGSAGRLTRPFGVTLAKLASRGSSMLQLGSAEERTSAEHSATLKVAQRLGLLGESD